MGWTNLGVLTALLVIIGVVGIFGAYAGYTVDGSPQGIKQADSSGTGLEVIKYLGNLVIFQVDGMPFALNIVFEIMGILGIYLIYACIRGLSS